MKVQIDTESDTFVWYINEVYIDKLTSILYDIQETDNVGGPTLGELFGDLLR